MDNFTAVMVFEGNWELVGLEPCEDTYIEAAQHLIDTGQAWTFQGSFGRTCQHLIDEGYCTPAPNATA